MPNHKQTMDDANNGKHGRRRRLNAFTLLSALLASTTSLLLGYDIGVMSGAAMLIRENLKISWTQEEILVGTLNVFSLIGSLASGKTSDCIGRRYTIVLASLTFLIGAILMGLAPSFPFILLGRMVAGIGVGYALMIAPLYTAELSPPMTRGFLTSLPEVFITLGILLGYVINYALSGLPLHLGWRLMLGMAAIPAIAIALGVIAMPESPRWLVLKGKLNEAKEVLLTISTNPQEAELRLQEITQAAGPNSNGLGVWKELLLRPTRPIKRMLVTAIGGAIDVKGKGFSFPCVFMCLEASKTLRCSF
ncbi:hypothetical protein RJT34_04720 [Clitoria ternatea]|uniref:Major facilitator superfamily (MFS) profile domain-containing protein n=1 Tax=Clitoria ternatea TaxID=43366 RepID=A0AAN9KP40_CLITE